MTQPADELAVNDTVDAVGFDFVRRPELEYSVGANKGEGKLFSEGFIKMKTFRSEAAVRESLRARENRETLSMVMLDFDFDSSTDVFAFDAIFYAGSIQDKDWELRFPLESVGAQVMAVFIDIYGNEAREVIPGEKFGAVKKLPASRSAKLNVAMTKAKRT